MIRPRLYILLLGLVGVVYVIFSMVSLFNVPGLLGVEIISALVFHLIAGLLSAFILLFYFTTGVTIGHDEFTYRLFFKERTVRFARIKTIKKSHSGVTVEAWERYRFSRFIFGNVSELVYTAEASLDYAPAEECETRHGIFARILMKDRPGAYATFVAQVAVWQVVLMGMLWISDTADTLIYDAHTPQEILRGYIFMLRLHLWGLGAIFIVFVAVFIVLRVYFGLNFGWLNSLLMLAGLVLIVMPVVGIHTQYPGIMSNATRDYISMRNEEFSTQIVTIHIDDIVERPSRLVADRLMGQPRRIIRQPMYSEDGNLYDFIFPAASNLYVIKDEFFQFPHLESGMRMVEVTYTPALRVVVDARVSSP